jgi:GT2 family glycosyltransferase
MIDIISATRLSHDDFLAQAPLGASLKRLAFDKRIRARVAFENRAGLPVIYNAAIDAPQAAEILVFMHDDVWIDDYFFVDRIMTALQSFDVIGPAGNRRRLPRQPSWAFRQLMGDKVVLDSPQNLAGAVAHGKGPFGPVSFYGQTPAACELLDGVLLAARRDSLRANTVRFDPRFDFHFYDLDFCRSARTAGLNLGCAALALTHRSEAGFTSPRWRESLKIYLEKWGE